MSVRRLSTQKLSTKKWIGVINDPYYSSVVASLHGNGTNGSTTFTDSSPLASNWSILQGSPTVSTTQSKFGGSSLYFNGSASIVPTAASSNFSWGTGDFTIEMMVYTTSVGGVLMDGRPSGVGTAATSLLSISTDGTLNYVVNGVTYSSSSGAITANTWYHIAASRSGTSLRLFINGTQVGSTWTDSTNYSHATGRPVLGGRGDNTSVNFFTGYVDDARFTKGVARYTANFTAPTVQFADA